MAWQVDANISHSDGLAETLFLCLMALRRKVMKVAFRRKQNTLLWLCTLAVSLTRELKKRWRCCTERDSDVWGEIGRGGSLQLWASLGFLLPTSFNRGQTSIIRLGRLPAQPLWHGHGTLVCLFETVAKLSPFTCKRERPLADSWQVAQRGHSPPVGRSWEHCFGNGPLWIFCQRDFGCPRTLHLLRPANLHEVTSSLLISLLFNAMFQ